MKNSRIKDTSPENILINCDFLKAKIAEDNNLQRMSKERDISLSVLCCAIGVLISAALPLLTAELPILSAKPKIVFVVLLLLALAAVVTIAVCIQNMRKNKKQPKDADGLTDILLKESQNKTRYTALIVICYQKSSSGEMKYMTERRGNYLIHCPMDSSQDVYAQRDGIKNYLMNSYNIQEAHIVDIQPLDEKPFFSVKPIHGEITQNAFVFFSVKLKRKAKEQLANHRDVSWITLHEMEGMPDLMGRNQDIVMALRENTTKISDSFWDPQSNVHVIWNITNKCQYDCAFCATKDTNRAELSIEDKLTVLNHINRAKDRIGLLDIAGGDPLIDPAIRKVVLQAADSLGDEKVSVTTTGMGLDALSGMEENEIESLINRCEITIDASHECLGSSSSRVSRGGGYCANNLEQLQEAAISDRAQTIIINIPIIDDDLSDEEVCKLIQNIQGIKEKHPYSKIQAQLIRLMPVGAYQPDKEEYKQYNPVKLATLIMQEMKKVDIPCKLHCSLRVLRQFGEDKRCSLLETKVTVDCAGNVFACSWGAYLNNAGARCSDNPFYLGNLVTMDLQSILDGSKPTVAYRRIAKDIQKKKEKRYCEVVSYYMTNTVEDGDPLAKQ